MFGSGEEDAGEDVREFLNAALALFSCSRFRSPACSSVFPYPRPVASCGRGPVWTTGSTVSSSYGDKLRGNTQDLLSILLSARDVEGDGSGLSRADQGRGGDLLSRVHEMTVNALTWCGAGSRIIPKRSASSTVRSTWRGRRPPRPMEGDLTYTAGGAETSASADDPDDLPVGDHPESWRLAVAEGRVVILSQYVTDHDHALLS